MIDPHTKVLIHPDLEITVTQNTKGETLYSGVSRKYEPFEATATTAMDCFFKFNIQLAEQKLIAALMRTGFQ